MTAANSSNAFPKRPFASQHGSAAPSDETDVLDREGFVVPLDDGSAPGAIELRDDDGFAVPPSPSEVAHALERAEAVHRPPKTSLSADGEEEYDAFVDFLKTPGHPSKERKVVDGGDVEAADAAIAVVAKGSSSELKAATGGSIRNKSSVESSRRSSLFADRGGHTLDFSEILLATRGTKKKPSKKILDGISGSFVPKTLTAVMGPSGSGKTSLMKILTGRIGSSSKLDRSGTIRLDGTTVDTTNIGVRKHIAFVEQDVSIPATSTPREAIAFSAKLRLDRSTTQAEIDEIVDDILEHLGLQQVADTLIGGGPLMAGGLSGGEKKRVQCGVELVTSPEIVVLDEPTSGLDSYSAQSLMEVLKKIADAGATVIVTIHQPPPPVVRKIDNLMLMLGGKILYDGSMDAVEEEFLEKGFPKPGDYNIADWILEVAQTNSSEDLEKMGFFTGKLDKDDTKQSKKARLSKADSTLTAVTEHVGIATQIRLLFGREFKKLYRDKFAFLIRVISNTVFGLLFGLIFFEIGKSSYIPYPEVMASFGAFANLLISTMFGVAQSSLMELPKDRPVFLSMECVTILVQVLVQQIASFFLIGFKMSFFAFLALNFMLAVCSTSVGICVGSIVEDPNVAAELMPALIVPQLLFSGFFIQTNLIPEFLRWAQYLCSLTYAVRLTSLYEFGDCTTLSCQNLLANNDVFQLESYWYWIILVGITAIFRISSLIILRGKASF